MPAFRGDSFHIEIKEEMFATIYALPGTNAQRWSLNPGCNMFPWLKTMANMYERWTPEGMVIHYKPLAPPIIVPAGTVTLAVCTDPNGASYTTVLEAMEGRYSCTDAIGSNDIWGDVECEPDQLSAVSYLTRQDFQTQPDLRATDIGFVELITDGIPAATDPTTVIGQLWVSYKIKLFQPKMPTAADLGGVWHGAVTVGFGGTTLNMIAARTGSIIPVTCSNNNKMYLPNIECGWVILCMCTGTAALTGGWTVGLNNGLVSRNTLNASTAWSGAALSANTALQVVTFSSTLQAVGQSGFLSFTLPTAASGNLSYDLFAFAWPGTINIADTMDDMIAAKVNEILAQRLPTEVPTPPTWDYTVTGTCSDPECPPVEFPYIGPPPAASISRPFDPKVAIEQTPRRVFIGTRGTKPWPPPDTYPADPSRSAATELALYRDWLKERMAYEASLREAGPSSAECVDATDDAVDLGALTVTSPTANNGPVHGARRSASTK
jgi:hypothetical protein